MWRKVKEITCICSYYNLWLHGVYTVDKSWIGSNAEQLFQEAAGIKMAVVNDADAAGYAEMAFGAGSGEEKTKGIVMMLTFGTGIGTAMFVDGILVRILVPISFCTGTGAWSKL